MAQRISVVVCAYDERRWEQLARAVGSLHAQTRPVDEVIVVVDHNQRLLAQAARELHGVAVVDNDDRQGLSGARNSGVRAATGDIIAFMDDDALAECDWLARLEQAYVDDAVAGVGGSIEPAWEKSRPGWFPEEFDWVVGCTYRGMPETTSPVRNLIGANMSFTRRALVAGGAFRSGIGRVGALPVGCEETELCIRVGQALAGTRFIFEPGARVLHDVPATRSNLSYFLRRCFNEGRSKALVTAYVGARGGLSTEGRYATRTLPRGVVRSLAEAARQLRPGPLAKGLAIATGLAVTTAGYGIGKLQHLRRRTAQSGNAEASLPWITNTSATTTRSPQR